MYSNVDVKVSIDIEELIFSIHIDDTYLLFGFCTRQARVVIAASEVSQSVAGMTHLAMRNTARRASAKFLSTCDTHFYQA